MMTINLHHFRYRPIRYGLIFTLFFVLTLSACSQSTPSVNAKPSVNQPATTNTSTSKNQKALHAKHQHTTTKPTAPIHLQSNYDKQSVAGEYEDFNVILTSGERGKLSIMVSSSDGILAEEINKIIDIDDTTLSVSVPISVIPTQDGKFYLDILASIEYLGPSGDTVTMSRAFREIIWVGQTSKKSVTAREKTSDNKQKVIVMPATETVLQGDKRMEKN